MVSSTKKFVLMSSTKDLCWFQVQRRLHVSRASEFVQFSSTKEFKLALEKAKACVLVPSAHALFGSKDKGTCVIFKCQGGCFGYMYEGGVCWFQVHRRSCLFPGAFCGFAVGSELAVWLFKPDDVVVALQLSMARCAQGSSLAQHAMSCATMHRVGPSGGRHSPHGCQSRPCRRRFRIHLVQILGFVWPQAMIMLISNAPRLPLPLAILLALLSPHAPKVNSVDFLDYRHPKSVVDIDESFVLAVSPSPKVDVDIDNFVGLLVSPTPEVVLEINDFVDLMMSPSPALDVEIDNSVDLAISTHPETTMGECVRSSGGHFLRLWTLQT